MCSSRRLTEQSDANRQIMLEFSLASISGIPNEFVSLIRSAKKSFTDRLGLTEADMTIDGVGWFPAEMAGSTDTSAGGTIYALIELNVSGGHLIAGRRLAEISTGTMDSAVADSIQNLIGSQVPPKSIFACTSTAKDTSTITANVSLTVESNLVGTQKILSDFLMNDSTNGNKALPTSVSQRSGIPVTYAPGYIPVVWSDTNIAIKVVVILPYVLAGVGVIVLILAILLFKYRFVIRSFFSEMVSRFGPSDSRWGVSSYGPNWRTVASLLNRGKSEISSTPDTATNVDDDEFDDMIIRNANP